MNPDFLDMLRAFSAERVEYLVVGAYALAAHGVPRATGDMDLWVRPSAENAARVMAALRRFGAALGDLTPRDLATPGTSFQIGVAPRRIDILTSIDGVEFDAAWPSRVEIDLSGTQVLVIGRSDFIRNKHAVGRPKDLADIDSLENG